MLGMEPKRIIGDFWETVYFDDRPINDHLFMDDAMAMQTGPDQFHDHFVAIFQCDRLVVNH